MPVLLLPGTRRLLGVGRVPPRVVRVDLREAVDDDAGEVPTFVVSPWTMRGKGPSLTLDHCSILKTVLARFAADERPFLGDRVQASYSFDAFLTEAQPRMDVPTAPTVGELPITERRVLGRSAIVTPPPSRKRMREGSVDYHDLTGRLARMLGR